MTDWIIPGAVILIVLVVFALVGARMSLDAERCNRRDEAAAERDRLDAQIRRIDAQAIADQAIGVRARAFNELIDQNPRIRRIDTPGFSASIAPDAICLDRMPRDVQEYRQDERGGLSWSCYPERARLERPRRRDRNNDGSVVTQVAFEPLQITVKVEGDRVSATTEKPTTTAKTRTAADKTDAEAMATK